MRLYCDNIDTFIDSINHHYSVTNNRYEQGKVATLFDDYKRCDFRIENVIPFEENTAPFPSAVVIFGKDAKTNTIMAIV